MFNAVSEMPKKASSQKIVKKYARTKIDFNQKL